MKLLKNVFLFILALSPIVLSAQIQHASNHSGPLRFGGYIGHKEGGRAIMVADLPKEKVFKECQFFEADSLKGFDFEAASKGAELNGDKMFLEFRTFMRDAQIKFVKKKYGIANFPFEITENTQRLNNPTRTLGSSCNNLDFENGNMTGWNYYYGYNSNSNGAFTYVASGTPPPYGTNQNVHACKFYELITSAYGNDLYGNFAGLDPVGGGTSCARLGGDDINLSYYDSPCNNPPDNNYSSAEDVEQTFVVTAANALLSYNYAVVLNDGGHPNGQQPYFKVLIYNSSGVALGACSQFYQQIQSGVAPPGFALSGTTSSYDGTQVYYLPWKANSVNLSAYIGQTLTIAFVAAGCTQGGHFGYGYIDASCGPVQIASSNPSPCVGSSMVLTSPAVSGGTYSWSGPGVTGATTQTVSVTSSGTYSVTITPALGAACAYTLTLPVTFNAIPTVNITGNLSICYGTSTILTGNGATSYTWMPGNLTSSSLTVSPTSNTSYTLTGSNGVCTSTTSPAVTVVVNPTPTLTINSPTICNGSSATLNITGNATSYSWTPSTGLSATTGASVTANPSATTTYTVIAAIGSCGAAAISVVTVNPTPTVSVNSATICKGNSVSLNATGNGSSYSWSPPTGLSGTTGASVSANPTVTTTYTVTTSIGSCTAAAASLVTVNPTPTLSVNSAVICNGSSTTLNVTGNGTSYSWSPSTGLSGTTGTSVTANPSTTTTYTVIATIGSCTTAATSLVTVNPTPTLTVNSATICNGTSTTLNVTGNGLSYAWSPPTGLSGTTGASVTANPSATTTYTIVATIGSCTASATSLVTVNPTPTLTVNSPTICAGGSTILTVTGNGTSYSWGPATGLSGTTGTSVTANPATTTPYTIVASIGTCTASVTSLVTVNTLPNVVVTPNNSTLCSGQTTTLTASGASSYTWTAGVNPSNSATVTASPTNTVTPASYTVTGSDVNGCVNSAVATISVTTTPAITISGSSTVSICIGGSKVITAAGATTYTWSPATGLSGTSGASVTANPTVTTVYSVNGTASGCGGATPATFTVTVNPLPTLTLTAAPSPSVCLGSAVTFTSTGATTYTWTSSANGGLGAVTGSTVTATPTSTAIATYTVTGTNNKGCVNTNTVTINVNPLPAVTITAANSGTVCSGNGITLTGNNANTYSWTSTAGGGLSGSTGTTVTVTPTSSPSTYSVVGTNTVTGCINKAVTSVTVVATPTITVTNPSNGNNSTICQTTSVTLTANGGSTYTWSPATGLSATTGSSVVASPTNTTTATIYTVTGTSTGGCTSSGSLSGTFTVNVNPLPTLSLTAIPSPSVCLGSSVTFTATGANTYTWTSSANGGVGSNTGSIITVTPTNTNNATYTVTAASVSGCVNTKTVTININPLPVVTITTANSGTVCSGNGITLTGNNANTYSWTSSTGGGLSGSTGTTVTVTPTSSPSTYTIVGTNTITGCKNNAVTSVTVVATPTISVTNPSNGNNSAICQNASVNLTASGSSTYTWSPATGLSATTGSSVVASPTNTTTPTIYTVTGTSTAGCISPGSSSGTFTVTVNPLPNITITPSQTMVCTDNSATLTANGGSTYTWTSSPNGGLSGNNGSPVIVTPSNSLTATYTVTGSNVFTCTKTAVFNLAVNQTPIVSLAGGGVKSQTICGGGLVNYTVSPITFSVTPAGSITWTNDNTGIGLPASGSGNIASYPAPTVTVQTVGSITVSAIASGSGCPSSTSSTLIYTITINPIPGISTPTITPASCGISNGVISGANGTGGSTYQYSWDGGTTFTSSSSYTNAAGTYPLQVKDVTTGCIYSKNFTISNPGAPVAPTIVLSNTAACVGSTATFSIQTPTAGYTYNWSQSSGLNNASGVDLTTYTVTNIPSSPNPYVIQVTSTSANCTGLAGTTSVTINPLPVPSITVLFNGQVCLGSSTTLSVSPASSGYSYQWGNNAGIILGATYDTITVVNASSNTNYSVTVTNTLTGCAASTAANGSITVNSLPVIDTVGISITQSNCVLPTGAITNVTYTVAGNGTYVWTVNSSTVVVGVNPALGNVPAGQYCVQVTDDNGCVNKFCYISVTNAGAPTPPTLVTSINDTIYCNGNAPQTLTVTATSTGTVIPTINWYSSPGPALTTTLAINTNTYTPSASLPVGTTTLYVTATVNGCESNGKPVTITILPTPTISIAPLGSNSVICSGTPVIITPSGGTSYTLNPGNQSGTSFTVSPSSSTTYTVSGSNSATGCLSASSDLGVISITVNPTPTISIAPLANNGVICNGSSVVISPSGASSFTLNPGNQTGTSFTVSPNSNTTYTINGSNSATGCLNATTDVGVVTVTVSPTPTITIAPLGSNAVICSGGSVLITPAGASTYTLNPGTQTGTSFTVTPTGTTTYTISGSDNTTTCSNLNSNAGVVTVTVNPTPTVNVSNATLVNADCGQPTGGVSGLSNASVSGGTLPYSYQWVNTTTGQVVSNTPVLSGQNSGTYSLLVTDGNNCVANVTGGIPTFTVPPSQSLQAQFTTNPNPATGTIPLAITFSNTSNAPVGSSYSWSFGDNSTDSSGFNASHTYTTVGTYTAILTVQNGNCTSTATVTILAEIPTTIIIPNIFSPNGDGINDEFFIVNTGMSSLNCQIFNRWGELMSTLTAPNQTWDGRTPNGDKAPEGTYMYILQAQGLDSKTYKQQGTLMLVR